jgi:uncharacterized protein (DUF58 family)
MTLFDDASALRTLHVRARGWARVLKLPFRQQRWRGHAGEFLGGGTGSSLDFQDHRLYLPGDDPRQINWQAYARTGTYSMKLYREEVRPLVDVIMDVSASMFAFPAKEQRAALPWPGHSITCWSRKSFSAASGTHASAP